MVVVKKYALIAGSIVCMVGFGWMLFVPNFVLSAIREGFPAPVQATWGHFAKVRGSAPEPVPLTRQTKPVGDWSRRLFRDSEGTALLALHGQRIILEEYAPGYDRKTRFNSYSMVKSLVGLLVLRAMDEGRINSLSDPIGRYLPDFSNAEVRQVPIEAF